MLILERIIKCFGDGRVLNGVSLRLDRGRVYTLQGGNGSGKTTLLNIISGFLKPTSGTIRFRDRRLTKFVPYKINRLGIGRTFQDLRLATQLTVYENVLLALERKMFAFPTQRQRQRVGEILEKISLWEKRGELAGEISYGQQKLLTLGCCIANDADLLLIDEPVAGIDTANQEKITTLICSLKQDGKTILQIEHNTKYIEATSDQTFHLENGVVIC
jgi:branched-chain amino acid transport system ATP-binding protein